MTDFKVGKWYTFTTDDGRFPFRALCTKSTVDDDGVYRVTFEQFPDTLEYIGSDQWQTDLQEQRIRRLVGTLNDTLETMP